MSWRFLGRFVLTKSWQYTATTNYQIFRLKNNFISNKDNQYLKGAISSVFLENQKVNLFDSRRLSWRNEPEIFVFDFPKALGSQRIGLRRLDDTKLIWSVDIEVFEVEMSNLQLSLNGLAITDVEGLQLALAEKASKSELTQLEQELLAAIANISSPTLNSIQGLQSALDEKASTTQLTEALNGLQSPTLDTIQGLQSVLDSKASTNQLATSIENIQVEVSNKIEASIEEIEAGIENLTKFFPKMSPTEPTEPFNGMVWNEISGGNLVETWVRLGFQWVSQQLYALDFPSPTSSVSGSVSYSFALNFEFNYLMTELSYHYRVNGGTIDGSNFWRVLFTCQPTGVTFADSGAIPSANTDRTIVIPLNTLLTPAAGERLLLMMNKTGNAPGARIAASLRFRKVRK